MQLPLISENILNSLASQIESGILIDTEHHITFNEAKLKQIEAQRQKLPVSLYNVKASKSSRQGVYMMEVLLNIGDNESDNSFRHHVKKRRNEHVNNPAAYTNYKDEILSGLFSIPIAILPVIPLFALAVALDSIVFLYPVPPILLVMVFICRHLIRKKQGTKYQDEMNKMRMKNSPSDLLNFSQYIKFEERHLINICNTAGIDVAEARPNLGNASGGGNTYIGWGSAGAIGLGLGLSALSGINNAANNSVINGGIRVLEKYIFYNNVAWYFNNNVDMEKLLASQNKLSADFINLLD